MFCLGVPGEMYTSPKPSSRAQFIKSAHRFFQLLSRTTTGLKPLASLDFACVIAFRTNSTTSVCLSRPAVSWKNNTLSHDTI